MRLCYASRTAVATTGETPATRCLLNGGNPRTALARLCVTFSQTNFN
ncbi:hypothetical protein [Chroococcidiopsis sp. CCALA 051]|nr:hypothetical protein [Chroococcidiopsis sp. CCALA 051]